MSTDVQTSKQSFWTHKNNNAKYGFFPTPLDVVQMEMNLIDFSNVSPGVPITIADFTGGEGEQLQAMHNCVSDFGLSAISYYNEITKQRYETALSKYKDIDNFHLLNTDFIFMKLRNKDGKSYSKSCIAILRNNPPYIWMQQHGVNVRSEDVFFTENSSYNIPGGVQIMEIPKYQLIQQTMLMRKFTYRYENIHIFKFPREVFKNFDQIVVFGVKKLQNSNDIQLADEWVDKLKDDNIPWLDEVSNPIYVLTDKVLKKVKPVNVFRDGRVNNITLTHGLNDVLDSLLEAEKEHDNIILDVIYETPIIEKLPGHIASEMASGKYNGIMGNCLIRGGTKKVIQTTQTDEGDASITEETEVLKPFIELTNKSGDIVFKDY